MRPSLLALPDRKLGLCLALLILPLLFLPKISIVQVSGETAGLRIDDLILLGFSVFFLLIRLFKANGTLKIEKIFALFLISSFIGFLINRITEQLGFNVPSSARIFYSFRLIEYFLFFYVGYYLSRFLKISNLLLYYLLWIGAILLLQSAHLVGEFSSYGYRQSTNRPSGISTFPAEMGIILNMLFAYFLFHSAEIKTRYSLHLPWLKRTVKTYRIYLLFIVFFALIMITGARVALLALLFTCSIFVFKQRRSTMVFALLIPLALVLGSLIIMKSHSIYSRTNLLSWQNLSLVTTFWDAVDLNQKIDNPMLLNLHSLNVDISLWMRLQKWLYFIKHFVHSPQFWLFGFGPGTCGAALDGSILRIFLEGGIVGSALFILFFYAIYRQTPALKWIVINYAINMIFFDAHLAYKAMSLLLFISGYYKALESREQYAASGTLAMA